jgi:hypothetical protein
MILAAVGLLAIAAKSDTRRYPRRKLSGRKLTSCAAVRECSSTQGPQASRRGHHNSEFGWTCDPRPDEVATIPDDIAVCQDLSDETSGGDSLEDLKANGYLAA